MFTPLTMRQVALFLFRELRKKGMTEVDMGAVNFALPHFIMQFLANGGTIIHTEMDRVNDRYPAFTQAVIYCLGCGYLEVIPREDDDAIRFMKKADERIEKIIARQFVTEETRKLMVPALAKFLEAYTHASGAVAGRKISARVT